MSDEYEVSPWMCHICNKTSSTTESRACERCYKIACEHHMHTKAFLNRESGLWELKQVCTLCC